MTTPDTDLLIGLRQKADPRHSALLVIDVQNDFVADGGFFDQIGADVKSIQRDAVPKLVRLIDTARDAGVPVIFVQAIYDPEHLSGPMRERNARLGSDIPRCLTGSWGAEFYKVTPEAGEPVVIKHRYSAMVNTGLRQLLEEMGVRSLLLSGVATDTCVESAGRDAYFIDYYVTMVEDCCGAASRQDHEGAVKRFRRDYGEAVSAEQVIDAWTTARAHASA